MQTMLAQRNNPEVRAYFVWGPFLKTDNMDLARQCSERYAAPNSAHFWMPNLKLAQQLGRLLRIGAGKMAWDVFLLYKRGVLWDSEAPEPTYWQQQLEILQGDPFDIMAMEARIQQALRQ